MSFKKSLPNLTIRQKWFRDEICLSTKFKMAISRILALWMLFLVWKIFSHITHYKHHQDLLCSVIAIDHQKHHHLLIALAIIPSILHQVCWIRDTLGFMSTESLWYTGVYVCWIRDTLGFVCWIPVIHWGLSTESLWCCGVCLHSVRSWTLSLAGFWAPGMLHCICMAVTNYRSRNWKLMGSTIKWSICMQPWTSSNLLCVHANSASYPQLDMKWIEAFCHATIGVIINTTSLVILFTYLHIKQVQQSACLAVMRVCVHSSLTTYWLARPEPTGHASASKSNSHDRLF